MKSRHPEKIKNIVSPLKKKPDWIRTKITNSQIFFKTKESTFLFKFLFDK